MNWRRDDGDQKATFRETKGYTARSLVARNDLATLGAQFLSALADNALLFAALALVRKGGYPAWSGPRLQAFFVGTYILLAPFVGVFADARPKWRVMLFAISLSLSVRWECA
jgi:LPLT family lysophospholipid transporter-like MFS transporter